MKKIVLGILLIAGGMNLIAQREYVPTKEELARFKNTKTLIVMEDNPMAEFNLVAKDIMPKEWTITPFDFITWKDFEAKKMDPAYSFILLNQVKFQNDKTNAKYNFLSLLLGGTSPSIGDMADLCSVPLSYVGVDEDHYSYKLGLFLRFMQNHVQMLLNNPDLLSVNILKHYNDNIQSLQGKTIYLVADEIAKEMNTPAKLKKFYNGDNIKIVSREEIQKAIEDRAPNVVFLHKVGPEGTRIDSRCYKILVGVDDAKFYYFDYHMVGDKPSNADAFLVSDLKNIIKK